MEMRFRNRADAGHQLARALVKYENLNPLILALPRGGVAVAAEIAAAFRAPLDIILVRKIGAPYQPELALGAIVDGDEPVIVRNPHIIEITATDEETFKSLCRDELREIERRRKLYAGERAPLELRGRIVIVVDDGIATGATARAALRALKARSPEKLVLAVPVAPRDALQEIREMVDDVVCLADMGLAGAIGFFYDDFRQMTDKDVIDALARFPNPLRN